MQFTDPPRTLKPAVPTFPFEVEASTVPIARFDFTSRLPMRHVTGGLVNRWMSMAPYQGWRSLLPQSSHIPGRFQRFRRFDRFP